MVQDVLHNLPPFTIHKILQMLSEPLLQLISVKENQSITKILHGLNPGVLNTEQQLLSRLENLLFVIRPQHDEYNSLPSFDLFFEELQNILVSSEFAVYFDELRIAVMTLDHFYGENVFFDMLMKMPGSPIKEAIERSEKLVSKRERINCDLILSENEARNVLEMSLEITKNKRISQDSKMTLVDTVLENTSRHLNEAVKPSKFILRALQNREKEQKRTSFLASAIIEASSTNIKEVSSDNNKQSTYCTASRLPFTQLDYGKVMKNGHEGVNHDRHFLELESTKISC